VSVARREQWDSEGYPQLTLSELRGDALRDGRLWPDSRLNVWAWKLPRLLLVSLRGAMDYEGYPREKGGYTVDEMDDVLFWGIIIETSTSALAWATFLTWGALLLDEWAERYEMRNPDLAPREHKSAEYIRWIACAVDERRDLLPPMWVH